MKHVIRVVVAVTAAALLFAAEPAPASTDATTLALQGHITFGQGGVQNGTMTIGAVCASAGVSVRSTSRVDAGAQACSFNASGDAQGNCTLWNGLASGTTTVSSLGSVGTPTKYRVQIYLVATGPVVTITGTATAPDGSMKPVVGDGALLETTGSCTNGDAYSFAFVGSLTIAN